MAKEPALKCPRCNGTGFIGIAKLADGAFVYRCRGNFEADCGTQSPKADTREGALTAWLAWVNQLG